LQRYDKHTNIVRCSVPTLVELLLKSGFPDLDTKVSFKAWADFKGAKILWL